MDDMIQTPDSAITAAITALISEFCWRVDSGDGGRIAELFTEDAIIMTPHFSLQGREAIADWFKVRADPTTRLSRHFWTNLRISGESDRYVAHAYAMTVVGAPPAPAAGADVTIGITTDEVVIENGIALFASRKLDLTYEGRLSERKPA